MHDTEKKYNYIRPNDHIEYDFFFSAKDIYTIDGWYSCPETGGKWYIANEKIIFGLDPLTGKYYSSFLSGFSFSGMIFSKEECEKLLKLKPFW